MAVYLEGHGRWFSKCLPNTLQFRWEQVESRWSKDCENDTEDTHDFEDDKSD